MHWKRYSLQQLFLIGFGASGKSSFLPSIPQKSAEWMGHSSRLDQVHAGRYTQTRR
jgi:hypothetical protein